MNAGKRFDLWVLAILCLGGAVTAARATAAETPSAPKEFDAVLVYPTLDDGSIMHWLAISPLHYDVAYLGDSMSADVLEGGGRTERTARPRAGDVLQKQRWQKAHFSGAVQGPTMCDLFNVAGGYFEYGITYCCAYLYSPVDRPGAMIAASSDDALKVILNGRKLWSNQIQRSPTYDSDQARAPLKKGWNVLMVAVDQVIGGHLLCARFLDGGKAVTDLEVSLDPPAAKARGLPAGPYNKAAADLMRSTTLCTWTANWPNRWRLANRSLPRIRWRNIAPRAAYTRATIQYSLRGEKSLGQADKAIDSLAALSARYSQDLLAQYALLDLAQIQETVLKDAAQAESTYRSFEDRYPQSTLAPKALIGLRDCWRRTRKSKRRC